MEGRYGSRNVTGSCRRWRPCSGTRTASDTLNDPPVTRRPSSTGTTSAHKQAQAIG